MLLQTPVSSGEVFDKITILEIKVERITCLEKSQHAQRELSHLLDLVTNNITVCDRLQTLRNELKQINTQLWEIEDNIRLHEKDNRFDDAFIELARQVYITNDQRAAKKLAINQLTGSTLVEVKSYEDYSTEQADC
ncbi:MAG: hypothetical protein CMF46_01625 [Legionellales bacterium]|nr:hypothetical protein [Legionellales bacterium]|tara:strand:+ start:387 stop:794 length:408 start_codon:yes stop_codon:yes gene_type:complete